MKYVEINTVCGSGSTGRIAVQIANQIRQMGDEALIVYGRGTTSYPYAYKMTTAMDNKLHGIWTRVFDAQGLGSVHATKKLVKYLEELKPDIIHLHLLHGYYINYEILFAYLKKSGIPVIWTMHDCWAFTGHCPYFDRIKCDKWKNGCYTCSLKKEYPSSYGFDASKQNWKRKKTAFTSLPVEQMVLVTPSAWLGALVRESFLGQYPVKVIHNGIDLSIFQPVQGDFRQKYHLEQQTILLAVANGMDGRKGLKDIIELSAMLPSDCKIVIVGGISGNVQIPDSILVIEQVLDVHELAEIYSSADIFLNLTLEDNFPTVNLEALACGLPVITYRTGGSPEAVTNECGIVVEQHDLQGVMAAIDQAKILQKEDCIERSHVFDMHQSIDQYISLAYQMGKGVSQ